MLGSYKGEKIMLATPLLRLYLDNGLQVIKIYQVTKYQPESVSNSLVILSPRLDSSGVRNDNGTIKN